MSKHWCNVANTLPVHGQLQPTMTDPACSATVWQDRQSLRQPAVFTITGVVTGPRGVTNPYWDASLSNAADDTCHQKHIRATSGEVTPPSIVTTESETDNKRGPGLPPRVVRINSCWMLLDRIQSQCFRCCFFLFLAIIIFLIIGTLTNMFKGRSN